MDAQSYLRRLEYEGPFHSNFETLRALHTAHMLAVPFENLDIIPLHRPIRLDIESLWDKIVTRRRGGFCYELNGLFAWLLRQAGFEVTYLNGRVFRRDGSLGIDFDHLALLVSAPASPSQWLADVGFGDSFMEPLVLSTEEQPQGLRAYRLEQQAGGYALCQRGYEGEWKNLYFFDLQPHAFPVEYESGCHYHETSAASTFTRNAVVSRATPSGRITLEQDKLITTDHGRRFEQGIAAAQWPVLLEEQFGIRL